MKIIFICGCLEPGKDGVGDYTRRLACELVKQGIIVGALALNDYFVNTVQTEKQASDGSDIQVYRIPGDWNRSKKKQYAKKWVENHNPEWLSLQFVLYSYNKKGLPFGLRSMLKDIAGDRKWHIMCHELWIGISSQSPLKEFFLGSIQKIILKRLLQALNPEIINTQIKLYQSLLNQLGFETQILPLFSNIPFHREVSKLAEKLNINKVPLQKRAVLILFGSIHPLAPVQQFASEAIAYFKKERYTNISLCLIGRTGEEKYEWINVFESKGFVINDLGEENIENISIALQKATIGLSTTPLYLIEKSGTAIAMRLHKLPIISVSKHWRPRNGIKVNFPNDVLEYKEGNFENVFKLNPYDSRRNEIKEVAKMFINSLI